MVSLLNSKTYRKKCRTRDLLTRLSLYKHIHVGAGLARDDGVSVNTDVAYGTAFAGKPTLTFDPVRP
jgi:hypothetical protein